MEAAVEVAVIPPTRVSSRIRERRHRRLQEEQQIEAEVLSKASLSSSKKECSSDKELPRTCPAGKKKKVKEVELK